MYPKGVLLKYSIITNYYPLLIIILSFGLTGCWDSNRSGIEAAQYGNEGLYYNQQGNFAKAIEKFNTALELDSTIAEVHYGLAVAYANTGDIQGAKSCFDKAKSLGMKDIILFFNSAMVNMQLKDLQAAYNDLSVAIQIDPNYAAAYYQRAILRYNAGDQSGGCEDFKKAAELGIKEAAQMIDQFCNN